jgi:hypothetical protein
VLSTLAITVPDPNPIPPIPGIKVVGDGVQLVLPLVKSPLLTKLVIGSQGQIFGSGGLQAGKQFEQF